MAALPAADSPGDVPVRGAPDPHHGGEAGAAVRDRGRLRRRHHAPALGLPAALLQRPVSRMIPPSGVPLLLKNRDIVCGKMVMANGDSSYAPK